MQALEPDQRSRERRKTRRQQRQRWLLIVVAFIVGVILGWWVIGWRVAPFVQSDARDLKANAKIEYVAMVVESWSLTQDTALAQERLRGLDQQELTAILRNLSAEYLQQGEAKAAASVSAFAASYGLKLESEDGSWVLMRPSGTEPVVRVYCEAATQAGLDHLAEAARAFVEKP